jgi:N-acetylneuraminate synthase
MASSWDIESQYFLRQYNLKYNKIASALLTNKDLLSLVAEEKKYTFISTGMSTLEQIQEAINIFKNKKCEFELMHCNSTYPMKNEEANLKVIETLRKKFKCKVGYSDHSAGRIVSLAAVAIGATSVERHVTLDKAMYGSDQPASLETLDFKKLVIDIRQIEKAFGSSVKRIMDSEIPIMKKLRRV